MAAGDYTIKAEQGASFLLFLEYQDDVGVGIPLKYYKSAMQVRRSVEDPDLLLTVTGSTVNLPGGTAWTGALTGPSTPYTEFGLTGGISGSGNIRLDVSAAGATGSTGGILVTIDGDTMAKLPSGKHFYDLEIFGDDSASQSREGITVIKIIKGRFEVEPEVTR